VDRELIRMFDLRSTGCGYDSQLPHCRETSLGKSWTQSPTHICPVPLTIWRY